jgi:hypothetical protein
MSATKPDNVDFLDEFLQGVEASCKQAGIAEKGRELVARVLGTAARKAEELRPRGNWMRSALEMYRENPDMWYREDFRVPTGVLARGAGGLAGAGTAALASLPLTAIHNAMRSAEASDGAKGDKGGSTADNNKDTKGSRGYLRNAMLAGLAGGAAGAYFTPDDAIHALDERRRLLSSLYAGGGSPDGVPAWGRALLRIS